MQNILIAAGCLLVSVFGANPSQDAPVRKMASSTTETIQVAADRTTPSAHQGLIVALGLLEGTALKNQFDLLSVESEVIQGTQENPATVSVSIEVRTHAAGGAAAEKAYHQLEANLAQELKKLAPTKFKYDQVVKALIDHTLQAPIPEAGAPSGTRRGMLQVVIPANFVGEPLPTEFTEDTAGINQYIRGTAAHGKIRLGAVNIKPVTDDSGTIARDIAWHKAGPKSRAPGQTQAANFLYKLEEGHAHRLSPTCLGK